MRYTGVRYDEYQTAKVLRKSGDMTIDDYRKLITKLNRKERAEIARRDTEALRARERTAKLLSDAAAAKSKVILDLRGKMKPLKKGGFLVEDEDKIIDRIKKACEKIKADKSYVQFSIDGVVVAKDIVDTHGGDATARYYNGLHRFIYGGNEYASTTIFQSKRKGSFRFVIYASESLPPKKMVQRFLDGSVHCVIQPLIDTWETYAKQAEKDSSKVRLNQIVKRLYSLLPTYKDGVPEWEMDIIGRTVNRCIVIKDLLNNSEVRYNSTSTKDFVFTNTRKNHLETGELAIGEKYEPVTRDELNDIIKEHNEFGRFLLELQIGTSVKAIRSVKGAWAVTNEDKEYYDEMNKLNGITNYMLNAREYPQVNELVREGRIIHAGVVSFCEEPNNLDGVTHIDMTKAYTQHKAAGKYYRGFPRALTHFCKFDTPPSIDFLRTHIGYYSVDISYVPSGFLESLGFSMRSTTRFNLPSVELEKLYDMGVRFDIRGGCWARHTFDIEYTEAMLEKRRYCTWAGKLGQETQEDVYTFVGDREWAQHLTAELGECVQWVEFQGKIQITIPRKYVYTNHHIFGFITAYTRINMFSMMESVIAAGGSLVKVILDGLYFRGSIPECGDIQIKEDEELKEHDYLTDGWYKPSTVSIDSFPIYNPSFDPPIDKNYIVLTGAGGTGKSWSVYKDSNLINTLYVVASKALGEDKYDEFGCRYTTIHRLLGDIAGSECIPWCDKEGIPGVGMMDEITQYDAPWIHRALTKYPKTFWLIAGDVDCHRWYQCRSGCDNRMYDIWLPKESDFIVPYLIDRRSLDSELRDLKAQLRVQMQTIFTDGGEKDALTLAKWLLRNHKNKVVTIQEAIKMFKEGDIFIAGKHKSNKLLLDNGIISGSQDKITKRIHYDTLDEKREVRGAFTVHSFQGFTIADKRVFIALDLFEYSMLVTAIGRVRTIGQLVFVR